MVDSPPQTRLDDFSVFIPQADSLPHEDSLGNPYYCKVLVTGPHRSGKTCFIRQLDDQAFCMDKINGDESTTIGFDFTSFYWIASGHGQRLIPKRCSDQYLVDKEKAIPVHFYGMPGLRHFSTVREILSQRSNAVILMVDSTNPSNLAEVKVFYDEIQRIKSPDTLVVIAANKQDLPNAVPSTDLQKILGTDLPVIPVSSLTGKGVHEIINFIMMSIYEKSYRT